MLLDRFDALTGRLSLWLVRVGAVVLAAMMLMTFLDVVGRYVFNSPIVGTYDMTQLYMGLIVYLGIGYTTHRRAHISVDLLTGRLGTRARLWFDLLAQVISGVLAALICWQLWSIAGDSVDNNDLTQIWELPIFPVVYVMAAASVLMVAALASQLLRTVVAIATGRPLPPETA